jgi:hypothetical protein
VADLLFNLNGSAAPVMLGVQLDQTRVHQQQAFDPVDNLVHVTQVIANGVTLPDESGPPPTGTRDSRGDLAINRVTLDGQVTGVMYCRAFDHGGALGVENAGGTAYLWLAYDAQMQPIGINAHGRKVVRLPFQNGAIIDVGDPGLDIYDPIPGADAVAPSLDADHGRMGIAFNTGGPTRYRVFDLDAFRARDFSSPLYEFDRPSFPDFQSWCLYGNYVYQLHGSAYTEPDNPPPPDGTGNTYWTVIDIRDGSVVQRVHNLHALTLSYREPESVNVWQTNSGPQLVFGFASSDTPPRLMNLYALTSSVDPDVALTAAVVTDPEPGVELTVNLADTTGIQTWTIYRHVADLDQPLVSGTGDTLATGSTWMDASPPGCIPVTYRLVIQRTTGVSEVDISNQVTYVPVGGCGSVGPVGGQPNVLGCASQYTAVVHWRGGGRPYTPLDRLTAVSWGRTLNDTSTASVTVATSDLGAECCAALGRVEPWAHELTVYRDGALVWQGPITRPVLRRGSVTLEAQDVFAWFDRLVNTFRVTYTSSAADAQGRRRGPITYIAWNHIRLNLTQSSLSVPPDYPGIMPYVVRRDTGLPTIKVEKDGSKDTTVWTAYLGDILREWAKRGLTWTTVGRRLLLRGRPTSTARATALLTTNHFAGDIEVIKDGTTAATYAFATTQQSEDISDGTTLGTGKTGTAYGRLDTLVEIQEEKPTDADLRAAARDALAGRYPVPVSINVPDNAQLTPDAPITIRQLVPGERIDLLADVGCTRVQQGFALSDVEVSWQAGQSGQGGGEQVGIGLIPLGDVDEELGG